MTERLTGTVKWFNNKKGYGFIQGNSENEDIFVHYHEIEVDGFKTLREGQGVEYNINRGPKGLQASKVTVLEEAMAAEC